MRFFFAVFFFIYVPILAFLYLSLALQDFLVNRSLGKIQEQQMILWGIATKQISEITQRLTGDFVLWADEAQALMKIGEIQVCAERFEWSGIYGPGIEAWKESQR